MRISDWSSDVCSSDLIIDAFTHFADHRNRHDRHRPPRVRNIHLRAFRQTFAVATRTRQRDCALEARGHQHTDARPLALEQRIRSEENTSELQSLMRISYAVFCSKKKNSNHN